MEIARLLAGPAAVSLSFLLAAKQVEPVASHFYLFAWYGLIVTCDQWVRRLEGRSLISRCGPGFGLLMLWSATAWFFFEFVNFRLENWYYVLVTDRGWVRAAGVFLAFATVFPGIFFIAHLLACTRFPRSIRGPALAMTPLRLELLQVAGAACLLLAFWFPRYCFPLVWVFAIAAVAPVNYRRGIDSLLRQLESGEYAPTLRMLLAGLIAGGFWELFNFWSRARWIYTVPFFEELKLFEMPLAGFLGFPPFAVECACLYRLLVWHRLAPPFGEFSGQQPQANRAFFLPLAAAVALLFFRGRLHGGGEAHHYLADPSRRKGGPGTRSSLSPAGSRGTLPDPARGLRFGPAMAGDCRHPRRKGSRGPEAHRRTVPPPGNRGALGGISCTGRASGASTTSAAWKRRKFWNACGLPHGKTSACQGPPRSGSGLEGFPRTGNYCFLRCRY